MATATYPIGSLTEYYKFHHSEDALAVLGDLHRMNPKVLSQVEIDILEGKPSQVEGETLVFTSRSKDL